MAFGFTTSSPYGSRQVMFDRFTPVRTKPRILRADFGDGYSQRLADGINTIQEIWTVSFKNREFDEADDIYQYFESLGGVESFDLTYWDSNDDSPPTSEYDGEKTIKVIATDWTRTYIVAPATSATEGIYTVTATLERIYE